MTVERVERLTVSGTGVTTSGRTVERVLPGEEIEIAPDGAARIVTPVVDRVKPPCRHFKACGGCVLQHASDTLVAAWKADVVERALAARDLPFPLRHVHTSPPQSRRRARYSGRRTKKGAMIGFHAQASDVIVEAPECQLVLPSLVAARPALEALTLLAASRKSEVSLIVTDSLNGLDVVVETDTPLTGALRIDLAGVAERFDLARLTWNDEPVVTRRAPVQKFGGTHVAPPAGAFLQATREGESALTSAVLNCVQGAKVVADLFAGSGTFSLPIAKDAVVHAVEGEQEMLEALDRGWRNGSGLKLVTTEARDLFRRPLEPDELKRFDCVVLDPPRAGAKAQVDALARSEVERIAMVSCNPVTFARDAQVLSGAGFLLDWVDVVDQFRWSAHVELAGSFTRK